MGDPLSVAGSAVGIISLGLQVCSEIYSYSKAWQGYNEDIQKLGSKANSLRLPLKRLRDFIEEIRLTDAELADDLEEKAMDLRDNVARLREKIDKYKPRGDSLAGRAQTQLRRAAHPFRKDALLEMNDDLNSMEQTLNTAVTIYLAPNVAKITNISIMQDKMLEKMEGMSLTLTQALTGGLPSQALLQSCCEHHQKTTDLINAAVNIKSETQSKAQNIDNITYSSDQSWAAISRLSKDKQRGKCISRSYTCASHLFRVAITASITASFGAGGFAIAPMLKTQVIHGQDSWIVRGFPSFVEIPFERIPASHRELIWGGLIHQFQRAFSEKELRPSDMISHIDTLNIVDYIGRFYVVYRDQLPCGLKVIRFLLQQGSVPNNGARFSALRHLYSRCIWREEERSLAACLLDIGGPLPFCPTTWREKENIRYLINQNEDWVSFPNIIKTILRESEQELTAALESGNTRASDTIQSISLLDYAFGWPRGLQILLEFGADPNSVEWWMVPLDGHCEQSDIDAAYISTKLLLKAGSRIQFDSILSIDRFPNKVRLHLIQTLVAQRKELWKLAQCYLPPETISNFGEYDDVVLDSQVDEVYEVLKAQGRNIDDSLKPSTKAALWPYYGSREAGQSIYHTISSFSDITVLDEVYSFGFRDIDVPDRTGETPSMKSLHVGNRIAFEWLLSKGASCNRPLTRSNATVGHIWSANTSFYIWELRSYARHLRPEKFKHEKASISSNTGKLLLSSLASDRCACPCSPGGCTALSVALRPVGKMSHPKSFAGIFYDSPHPLYSQSSPTPLLVPGLADHDLVQETLKIFINWSKAEENIDDKIVRSLTFEALRLKHICCIEIDTYFSSPKDAIGRSEAEIQEIMEEERDRYIEFEKLVEELNVKLAESGLPILEFLTNHWQPRIVEFLSHRDPFDQDHHEQTRKLGIYLEADGDDIPYWVHLLGKKVEDLGDEAPDGE